MRPADKPGRLWLYLVQVYLRAMKKRVTFHTDSKGLWELGSTYSHTLYPSSLKGVQERGSRPRLLWALGEPHTGEGPEVWGQKRPGHRWLRPLRIAHPLPQASVSCSVNQCSQLLKVFHWCFYSLAKSSPTLCDPMDCSVPGSPVLYYLLEFAQHSCSLSWLCYSTVSSSVAPFSSYSQSLPTSGSFPVSQFFPSGGQIIGDSASVSVLPMNIQGWLPLGWTGFIDLFQGKRVIEIWKCFLNCTKGN